MLVVKGYETDEGTVYCDACSVKAARVDQSVPMVKIAAGKPCSCDMCCLRFRAAA